MPSQLVEVESAQLIRLSFAKFPERGTGKPTTPVPFDLSLPNYLLLGWLLSTWYMYNQKPSRLINTTLFFLAAGTPQLPPYKPKKWTVQ